ncbi:MAG: ATP-grasp domain-containing protein [Candidatus Saccharibacteria bacterium]
MLKNRGILPLFFDMIANMKIALIYDPKGKYGQLLCKWLIEDGNDVDEYSSLPENWQNIEWLKYDLAIPLITIKDYVSDKYNRFKLAKTVESLGVKTTNSTCSIALSSDKYATYKAWEAHSIEQPKTYLLKELHDWPNKDKTPMMLKPVLSHSGDGISLVSNYKDALLKSNSYPLGMILQTYVENPICWRLIACPNNIVIAYQKILNGATVVNIGKGAHRLYSEPDEKLVELAKSCVKALGGGLMGVDILEKDGVYYALEANVPFGIDENSKKLKENLLTYIKSLAR